MYYTAEGLEKILQRTDRQRTENRQTEKAITEATLIPGIPGLSGQIYLVLKAALKVCPSILVSQFWSTNYKMVLMDRFLLQGV